jgi:hypothetical protein
MQTATEPGAAEYRRHTLLSQIGLALAIVVVHGSALFDETRHDDHLHRERLRTTGWGWNDLIESTTFELPGRQMHFWWQTQPVQWRYPRPVAMAILKAEFTISGGNTFALHAFGLAWHWLNCVLLLHFARWVLQSSFWAAVAAGLLAIGPHTAVAVSWTAAHNVLISNAFLLGALLCYARCGFDRAGAVVPTRAGSLCAAIGFWAAALLSREAAIVFPLLAIGLDLCFGGRAVLLRRWPVYAVLVALAAGYVAWRLLIFPRGGMPTGYLHAPTDGAYAWWALSKYAQSIGVLLAQLPLYAPLDYFEHWTRGMLAAHLALLAVIVLVTAVYIRGVRGAHGRWFGPLWLAVGLLPVIPIATSPHFAYTPYVGYALATPVFLRCISPRRRVLAAVTTVAFFGGMFALQRHLIRMQLRTEQLVIANVLESGPRPAPAEGSTLFFIDLPVSTTFSAYALREAWGLSDLSGYALTTSYVHESRTATRIERVGERTLELSCDPPGWFSQLFDRWLLRLVGRTEPLVVGTSASTPCFDAKVLEVCAGGVTRIRFDFHDRLDRPDWIFYAGSADRPMHRLRFDQPTDLAVEAHDAAQFRARHADWFAERNPLHAWRRRFESLGR